MSASNRAKLIGKLHTALKKNYTLPPAQPTRPLLEHALYASLLEDCPAELADEGLAKCEQDFFDWNEVRVTTVTELAQVLSRLPDPHKAATRLKGNLQAIFEEFYTFDLDHLKKENLGKAVAKFEDMSGMTPFVLSYIIQHGLGGHSIPIDYSAMVVMLVTGIASQNEAASGKVPGLERAIPKNKGIEFASLLHECAVALNQNPKDKTGRATLDAVVKDGSKSLDEWLTSKKAAQERHVQRKAEEKEAAKVQAEADAKAELEAQEAQAQKKAVAAKKASAKKIAPMSAAEQAAKTAAKEAKKKSSKKSSTKVAPKPAAAATEQPAPPKSPKPTKSAKSSTTTKKASSKSSSPAKKSTSKSASDSPKASAKTESAAAKKPSAKNAGKPSASKSTGTKSKKSSNRKLSKRKPR